MNTKSHKTLQINKGIVTRTSQSPASIPTFNKYLKISKLIYDNRWLLYTCLNIYISICIVIFILFIIFDFYKNIIIYLIFIVNVLIYFIVLSFIIIKNNNYYNKFKKNIRYKTFIELQNRKIENHIVPSV